MSSFETIPIDNVREYWNRRPCNIRHSSREVGTREYFDEVEAKKYFAEPHIPGFAEFSRYRGRKVLEIGCGIGTDTINFARYGARVTAVDLSEKSLTIARRRAEVFGVSDRIRFYQANAEELTSTIPVEPYDLIYSFGVIHHTPRPSRVLDQLRAYTKPDTTLKLMVYHHYSWKVFWIVMRYGLGQFWRTRDLVARYSEAQTGCPVTYTYSRESARKWLAESGFETVDATVDHIFPYRFPDYNEHQYVKVWYFRWLPPPIFRWLERNFGWHLCLTASPRQAARAKAA
jgi:2-polyprenyl-3-methyl-5-hydroxy-6-metoxy-1,4-benzoquinol methylase